MYQKSYILYRTIRYLHPILLSLPLFPLSIPSNVSDVFNQTLWKEAMLEEMKALDKNGTLDIVLLGKKTTIGCKRVYVNKTCLQMMLAKLSMFWIPKYQLEGGCSECLTGRIIMVLLCNVGP